MRTRSNWVVKIGGSLYDSPNLPEVVGRVNDPAGPAVSVWIVPGGGLFADQVRAAQKRWGLDDHRAHSMALLGMRQYGYLLAALGRLPTCERIPALEADNAAHAAARVWLPDEVSLDGHLARNWGVTSDSIAAWVAGQTAAEWLILIKSAKASDDVSLVPELVDAAFIHTLKAQRHRPRCALVDAKQWLDRGFSCTAYEVTF